uniref:Uncharacterized protein n=1 Tax=Tanacetum cinerariifolium TaxID=118510 RepID=A0A6L2MSB5_TANCI|nr:hypothetical protein [Tanacetum cinerariifolium]
MSNTNTNSQTQTSSVLYNAIMEAGGKDRPLMLASGYMENYKNVSEDIRDQLNDEAEVVQIILTWIDNDIYSTMLIQMHVKCRKQLKVYNPQNHPTHYTYNFSTKSLQAATRNKGKVIVNSSTPTYDQEPAMVAKDDEISKDKEIDKLMVLISLLFKKIYKPTNNNLKTSSNISRANQDNTLRINRGTRYDNQRVVNVVRARENLNVEQADWRDETDDEPEDQELEAHYMYMAQIQEVTPDAVDNSGPIFNVEPLQKVQNNNDNYNVFAIESEHPKKPKSVIDTYPVEEDEHNMIIDSLDMSYDREQANQMMMMILPKIVIFLLL